MDKKITDTLLVMKYQNTKIKYPNMRYKSYIASRDQTEIQTSALMKGHNPMIKSCTILEKNIW